MIVLLTTVHASLFAALCPYSAPTTSRGSVRQSSFVSPRCLLRTPRMYRKIFRESESFLSSSNCTGRQERLLQSDNASSSSLCSSLRSFIWRLRVRYAPLSHCECLSIDDQLSPAHYKHSSFVLLSLCKSQDVPSGTCSLCLLSQLGRCCCCRINVCLYFSTKQLRRDNPVMTAAVHCIKL